MAALSIVFSCIVLLTAFKAASAATCIHPSDCCGDICNGWCEDKLGVSTPVCIYVPIPGNLAGSRPASSSSANVNDPKVVVDENKAMDWGSGSCWSALKGDRDPWWQVELPFYFYVSQVQLTSRADCDGPCSNRLHDFDIELFGRRPEPGMKGQLCLKYVGVFPKGTTKMLPCSERAAGRFLRINAPNRVNDLDMFTLCEVDVIGGKILTDVTCSGPESHLSELCLIAVLLSSLMLL